MVYLIVKQVMLRYLALVFVKAVAEEVGTSSYPCLMTITFTTHCQWYKQQPCRTCGRPIQTNLGDTNFYGLRNDPSLQPSIVCSLARPERKKTWTRIQEYQHQLTSLMLHHATLPQTSLLYINRDVRGSQRTLLLFTVLIC